MMMAEVSTLFSQAFAEASKHTPSVYANLLRFVGMTLLFIGCSFAVSQFLSLDAKKEDEFMFNLVTRLMKLLFGVTLVVLLFKL
ncbi:Uncharacterised protein [Legionella beliardensis]|uniref:Uncharacterized protein n=1 Tax=Legionella beliardensis TaxID=91822 RepID=A0A378JPK2_9GAMM|nr:hypothetical protein [Legionella beliardensis]STX55453.1 Uncharacterised protein [Legionella beliardensis]STX55525.1 Uncharacterised protein [Legionella beliardensis]